MREEPPTEPRIGLEIQEDVIVFSVGERSLWVPRNSLTVLLAQIGMFVLVVAQISRTLRELCMGVISVVDDGFEILHYGLKQTKKLFTSENTGHLLKNTEHLLSNVQKILLIILTTLIILDMMNVVTFKIPKWVFLV